MSKKYRVVPVVTYEDSVGFKASVGLARTLTEARRLVREAGWRIMWVGGTHGLSPAEAVGRSEDAWTITVWP